MTFDFGKLIRGNWLAALGTALVATIVAVGVPAALIFLSDPPTTSRADQVAFSVAAAAATVSGNSEFTVDFRESSERVELAGSGGSVPIFITILAMGAAAWVFHRATRGYPRTGAALADAARAAVIFGLLMLVFALLGRREDGLAADALDFFAGSNESDLTSIHWGASAATTPFLAMGFLFVVLAIVCLVPRARLAPRVQRIRDILAPGVYGVTAFTLLLPLAGLLGYITALGTDGEPMPGDGVQDGDGDTSDVIRLLTGAVGNVGMLFLTIGAGGRLGEHHDGREFDEEIGSEWRRLGWIADETDSWGLWLSIPTVLAVVVACALLAFRSSRRLGVVGPGMLVWAGLMFCAVPLLSRWASIHGAVKVTGEGERVRADVYAGIRPVDSLLIPLIALALALLLAGVAGAFRGLGSTLAWTPTSAAPAFGEQPATAGTPPPVPPPTDPPTAPPESPGSQP